MTGSFQKFAATALFAFLLAALPARAEGVKVVASIAPVHSLLAGVMAGKRTADLIPLCHVLPGASITVDLDLDETLPGIVLRAEARITGQTGVEMEALTAVSVGLLTVYDMAKSLDRGMVIEGIRLLRKDGGQSGTWILE